MITTRRKAIAEQGRIRRAARAVVDHGALASLLLAMGTGAANAATLQEMDYTTLPGSAVQVNFTFDEAISEPKAFKTANPARIALDFTDVNNGLEERSLDIGVGAVTGVSTAEAGGRTRAVVKLSGLVPYNIERDGRIVQVRLDAPGGGGSATQTARSGSPAESGDRSADQADGNRITQIDFRRGSDGSGKVIVGLNQPSVPVDVQRAGSKVTATFGNTEVPDRLRRKLDVTDFATPVKSVTTRQRGDSVRIALDPSADTYEQIAYQADQTFTIELKPQSEEERERQRKEEFRYTGERLSLNFQDIEVRSVLQLIADFTGTNIVVSDSVSGSITLRLDDVPWDQALAIILRSKGLDKRTRGNVLWVAPAEQIAERERQRAEAREQRKDLAPLRSEFIRVNYAKASSLASLITGQGDNQKLLSDRGSLSVDQRTNTLIIRDTGANIEDVRSLVNKLDIPVRQVKIESRIVQARNNFSRDLGVQFGYSERENVDVDGADDGTVAIGGTQTGTPPVDGNLESTGNAQQTGFGGGGVDNLITSLPAENPAGAVGLAIGKVGSEVLQLELSAAENTDRAEIVSAPTVVTANQKEAFVERGSEVPFVSSDGDSVSTQFKEATLRLGVTPQITPDDRVLLDLEVSNDSIGETTPDGPAINTQSVGTQVLVDNGETVVLGGVFQRTDSENVTRVPFFGELPVVGRLFRQNIEEDNRRELLIFVTPKILDKQLQLNN